MKRVLNLLICFFASLFLIGARGECSEIPECANETEAEYCVISAGLIQTAMTATAPERLDKSNLTAPGPLQLRKCDMKSQAFRVRVTPFRILWCVFRE